MKKKIKQLLTTIFWNINPKLCFALKYVRHRKRLPNFKKPKDLSEIVMSRCLSGEIEKIAPYVDKIKMRLFVEEWGLGEYLPKLYGVWNSAEEIDFDSLPQSFALKTNHGCGLHYICPNKKELNAQQAKSIIRQALNTQFGTIEKQYGCITPQCFAEEYISDGDGNGDLPLDYKFHCCNGEIRGILVCADRSSGVRLATYDLDWNRVEWIKDFERYSGEIPCPCNFEKMKEIATLIAKKFDVVRVDLYSLKDGRIFIGELTFTPEGGVMGYFTNEAVDSLGFKNPQ